MMPVDPTLKAPFPTQVPFIDGNGRISRVWLDVLLILFKRTGGSDGADLAAIQVLLQQLQSLLDEQTVLLADYEKQINAQVPVLLRPRVEPPAMVYAFKHKSEPPPPVAMPNTDMDSSSWSQLAKANLPPASAANKGWCRFVTDATGATGIIPVYCDGAAWKRFSDDSVVN